MKSPLGLCQLPRTRRSPRPGVCGRDGLGWVRAAAWLGELNADETQSAAQRFRVARQPQRAGNRVRAEPRALRDGPGPTGVSEGGLDGVSEPSCRPHSGILAWGRLPGGQDAVALSSGLWTMMDVMGRGERGSEWAQGLGGRVCDEF